MKALIERLQAGLDLNRGDVGYGVTRLLSDQTDAAQKARFLFALHEKGESTEEIVWFVEQLVDRAVDPMIDPATLPGPMVDVCGTGGDGLDLFNVSTTIMFILAAGGAAVVKHGNRSVTSCCGSADVIEALGVRLEWPPQELKECVQRLGLCFIFARSYHPAFRALAEMRTQLAAKNKRTIFNLLGPLLNPVRPPRQFIGVYAPRLTRVLADVLRQLGRERAWVVHGSTNEGRGMADISNCGATTLAELASGKTTSAVVDCRWLGIPGAALADLHGGGDAAENAKTLEGILSGAVQGARRDLAVVNAAGGFVVAGLVNDLGEGIALAKELIDNGAALRKLRALQSFQGTAFS